MNIVFGRKNLEALGDKFTSLEVDTVEMGGEPVECFCIIDIEDMSMPDFQALEETQRLHKQMLDCFRAGDHRIAKDLIEHLKGRLRGHMDSFYESLLSRMEQPAK